MARRGTGPDAMEYAPLGVDCDTPFDSFVLRLTNAFTEKAQKMKDYCSSGPIQPGQATVIAISGALLPTAAGEKGRILDALLGDAYPEVEKFNGERIRTDLLRDPAYSHISAVIYCPSQWVLRLPTRGTDFTVVHNEHAKVKLPQSWLSVGNEYWREGDQLQSRTHT